MADAWKADPARGAEFVKPHADELMVEMRNAADVAILAIDANEAAAIENIKKQAAIKRAKIQKAVDKMAQMEPIALVRKYWSTARDTAFMHFLGDQVKIDGSGDGSAQTDESER